MKRTIAFPSVTSRQHSNFDGSEGNNLTLLHHPKRLQRDRVYENTDPDYMRRHVPTLVHLEKDRSPRFPSTSHETLEKREEAVASRTDASREQEERRKLLNATAMRGSFLLSSSLLRERSTVRDALLARRNERDQLALKTFPRDHFISTHRSSPQITMTKAERDPPHLKAQVAAPMVNTTTPPRGKRMGPTNHSDDKAEALEVGRSETAPPQLNPSIIRRPSQSPFPVAHDGAVGGGSKLADFLLPQIGSAPLPPPSSSPPPQQPARTEAKKDAERAEHEEVVLERPETPPAWTWGVPRHVSGPSLARTVGRDAPICHSPQPQVHPYEQANSSAPLLDVTSAMVKSKLRHVPTIALLASGREPLQPAPIPEDDPLFWASVRYQHDMNNSICPGFNTMQAKKKANAKKRRDDRNKEWKAFASTEDIPMVEEVDIPDKVSAASGKTQKQGIPRRRSVVFTASAPDDGASGGGEGSKSQSHKGQKKAGLPNSSSDRHGKIYTVARGSSRVEVNLNELYKTKRFQELLSMHDLLVQQSLESLTSSKIRKADEDAAQRANQQRQGYSSVRRSSSSSSDSSNDAPSSPNGKKKHHPDAGPSLPWAPAVAMTFDEALAESERRQQLLGLRRLSMLRDDASTKPDLSVLRRRSSAVNIGQGPGRFDSVASPTRTGNRSGDELELRATSGLQAVKGGVNLPESGLFRAHMRLKECYEQFVAENQTKKTLQELAATT